QDYKGQKLAEHIFQGIILVSAVIGFIYGFITEQFGWTIYIVLAGFAVSCLVSLHNNTVPEKQDLPYTAYLSLLVALGTFGR
ncbi:SPCS1 peptidase, partial [Polyodon spathula]|nr:SPCS1 peptidase [Polyodon spathula]